jgi:hypothetical protein
MSQLLLPLDAPRRAPLPAPMTEADRRFLDWHEANPHVYRTLVALAREAVRRGKRRIGMKALWERARWDLELDTEGDEFRLNNNFTSRFARLIEAREPDLRNLFATRRLRS